MVEGVEIFREDSIFFLSFVIFFFVRVVMFVLGGIKVLSFIGWFESFAFLFVCRRLWVVMILFLGVFSCELLFGMSVMIFV